MPSATVEIRRATVDDVAALAELRFEFRSTLGTASEDRATFLTRCTTWMTEAMAGDRWWIWVAVRAERVVGQVWLQRIEKLPNPVEEREWHGYISNVYVAPEARCSGVGEQLLAAALAACEQGEADSVLLWPTARSRSLYERNGFADSQAVMVKELGQRQLG